MARYAIFDATQLGAALELEQTGTVLTVNAIANINRTALALFPESIGRWYAELMIYGPGALLASIGIATPDASLTTYAGGDANGYGYRLDLGQIHHAGASMATVPVAAKGDIIGVLLDLTTTQPTVTWYRNGTPVRTQALNSTGPWMLAASLGGSEAYGLRCFLNAGQRAFEYPVAGIDGWYEPPQEIRGLCIASEDWLSDPVDEVPNERYAGLIAGDNTELRAVRSLDFWPWQRGVQTGAMVLTMLNDGSMFDELLAGDARDMTVRVGQIDSDQTYADRVPLYSAVIDNVSAPDDLTVKLTCRDPLGLLEVPLQRWLIRPDAEPAAANQPRPIVLGACRNVPAVLIDAPNLTYLVTDASVLGIGYVRDSGYALNPAAAPADFVLDATKTALVLDHEPVGKITADLSSVGGDQLPQPSDDILDGAGDPFTGTEGSAPDGFDSAGGDVSDASPIMRAGQLEFPLVQAQPTIYVQVPVYLSGVAGTVAAVITWIDANGSIVGMTYGPYLTGTQAWAMTEVIDTAPAVAVTARLEVIATGHTAGTMRVGTPRAYYIRYGDHDAIGMQNPDFSLALTGWTPSGPGWVHESTSSINGHDVDMDVAFFHGSGTSFLHNDGIAPVSQGARVTASCDAALYKGTSRQHPVAAVVIEWHRADDSLISYVVSPSLTKGDQGRFSRLSVTGTAPAGTSYAVFQLHGENAGALDRGPRFANCSWSFVLEPSDGVRTAIDLGDFATANRWQLGQGWSLKPAGPNGYLGGAYAEHAPGAAGVTSSLRSLRTANVRQAVAYAGWLDIGAAKFGAGKTYRVTVTITDMPDDGKSYVGLATGKTLDTMLVSWKKAGTYTVSITNTDGVDHPLYLLAVPFSAGGDVPIPPTLGSIKIIEYDDTFNPDPLSLVPATLQAIPLADYLHQVLDVRGSSVSVNWSLEDAQAIDTATGYAGIGVYLDGGETVATALDMALASYTACKWADGNGMIRFTRMIAPESVAEGDRAGTIDINAMAGDLVPQLDTAPGLTTQMGVRRNWAGLSDGDLVSPSTNFPLAVRQGMLRAFQETASTAQPLAGAYRHALYAAPVASCFDQQADGQAEIDRIAAIYGTARWFYAATVELDALVGIDLGQVWTLVYPKYGLAGGKAVMVIDYEPDLLAGTANIILWG